MLLVLLDVLLRHWPPRGSARRPGIRC